MIGQPASATRTSSSLMKPWFAPLLTSSIVCVLVLSKLSSSSSSLHQVSAFHLSFGSRLVKSANNPQLNPASTLIRPIECRNANNHSEVGICMFSIDCMQNKGTPLSVCKHNYFVGTCCRLPDYNNFVGIVYDLRDTETNQLLEARRVSPGLLSLASGSSTTTSAPLLPASAASEQQTSNYSSPAKGGISGSSSTLHLNAAPPPNNGSSSSGGLQLAQLVHSEPASVAPLPSTNTGPATNAPTNNKERPLGDRYMISSTSLFPSSPTQLPAVIGAQPAALSTSAGSQQEPQMQATSTTTTTTRGGAASSNGESARNADGGAASSFLVFGQNKNNKQQLLFPNELDSFHIQTAANGSHHQTQLVLDTAMLPSQSTLSPTSAAAAAATTAIVADTKLVQPAIDAQHQHSGAAYELIKDNESLEVLGTVNSAHSAAVTGSAQQQFNLIEHPSQQQNSVYLLDEQQSPSTKQKNGQQQQPTIVFANNHQHPSGLSASSFAPPAVANRQQSAQPAAPQHSAPELADSRAGASSSTVAQRPTVVTSSSSSTPSGQAPTSDQEFTLSSSSAVPQSEEPPAKTAPAQTQTSPVEPSLSTRSSSGSGGETSTNNVSTSLAPSSSSEAGSATPSPFTDLVSSHQTTTPFTTSLSTALLPNVSSHAYAPTTLAPSSPSPSSSPSALVSNSGVSTNSRLSSTSTTVASSSSPQSSSTQKPSTSESPSSIGFSQLYSNHHSSATGSAGHETSEHYSPPPTSASPPHVNSRPSLIHLGAGSPPLLAATKIVTGSSSANHLIPGLNGLQSAILSHIPFKIASGLSSGLSSYLQAAMKPAGSRPLLSSNMAPSLQYQQQLMQQQQANATKLAASSSSSTAVRFPGSSAGQPQSGSSLAPTSDISTSSFSTQSPGSTATTAQDVVKGAQLVCGRPQVSSQEQSATTAAAKKRVARIVGGNQSLFGQWPWMVSLRQWRKGAFLHKCGAALLNENWAITAAHCVENVKASDLLLRLGEFDVSNQEEPYPFIERRVKTVVSHPQFDPKTFEYDLALLRFAEPIKYERNIIPVCVPSGNDSYVDRMATVIGWGRLYEDGPLPDVIQHVDVPIITNNDCEKMYKNAGYIEEIPEMFICAGISKGGRDSCEGDSGGPLTMVDRDGRSYLVGIISWGIGCALPSQPGVYTRITAFSGWINQITAS